MAQFLSGQTRQSEDASGKAVSPRILVVGSMNMDLVVRSERFPRPGETLIGRSFEEIPGGKGANQAIAAARLGADVGMVGCIGNDAFGGRLRDSLNVEQVNTQFVVDLPGHTSGIAVISVEDSGQNCITVIPGANEQLRPSHLKLAEAMFASARVLIVQLEVPLPTVLFAMKQARQSGMKIILNPAPAPSGHLQTQELFEVDVICPNETETEVLTGIPVYDVGDATRAARRLCELGAKNAVITMGSRGALWCDGNDIGFVEAIPVNAVDTTAAGDAFTAALAIKSDEGIDLDQAVRFACAAGALAASRPGTHSSLPTREEVLQLLAKPK